VQPVAGWPKVAQELKLCGLQAKTYIFLKKKRVYCLLTLMTTPVHPHLVFTLSRPHCSTSKDYGCKS